MVNVGSVQSHRAQAVDMGWTYATSKGAVTAMSRRMALDLSSHGIRVNSISPGYTWTAMVMLHMLLVWMLNCVSLSTLYILLLLLLLLARSLAHSLTHSLPHALTHSRTRALTHSLPSSLPRFCSFLRSLLRLLVPRSFIRSFVRTFPRSLSESK